MKNLKQSLAIELGLKGLILFFTFLFLLSLKSFSQTRDFEFNNYYSKVHTVEDSSKTINLDTIEAHEFLIAGLSYLEKEPERAEGYFRYAISLAPEMHEAFSYMYYLKYNNEQYDSAEYYARQAVELNSQSVRAHLDLALALIKLSRGEEANQEVLAAALIDPDYVTKVGAEYITEHNSVIAAIYYFHIVNLTSPNNILNNLNFGYALRMVGQFTKAQQIVEKVYREAEQGSLYFNVIYDLYFKLLIDQEKYVEIIQEASIKVDPKYANQYLYKALSHYKLGKSDEFEKDAKKYFRYQSKRPPLSFSDWAINLIQKIKGGNSTSPSSLHKV